MLVFDGARGFVPEPGLAGWTVVAATGGRDPEPGPGPPRYVAYWLAQPSQLAGSPPFDILRVAGAGRGDEPPRPEALRLTGIDSLGEMTSLDVLDTPQGKIAWAGGKGGLLRLKADRPSRLSLAGGIFR